MKRFRSKIRSLKHGEEKISLLCHVPGSVKIELMTRVEVELIKIDSNGKRIFEIDFNGKKLMKSISMDF